MKSKNRWLIAASAVGIHICIGSVYAWSVYVKSIQKQFLSIANFEVCILYVFFSTYVLFCQAVRESFNIIMRMTTLTGKPRP